MSAASAQGFSFAAPYAIGFLFAGLAIWAAVMALSHEHDRPFSPSVVYLGLGLLGAAGIALLDLPWLDPLRDHGVYEHAAEFAVIVALFATGLKLEPRASWRAWAGVARLLAVAMPLTIAAVALFGSAVMGLSLGAAIALGACLAPTDPVLAGDIGVGPPGDEEQENRGNFAITGEAGFNDGLAFPFLLLGAAIASGGGDALTEWALADVVYGLAGAVLIGGVAGGAFARLVIPLRRRQLFAHELDGWLALSSVLFIYGACEVVGTYGFLGAFVGGLAFRRYESDDEANRRLHDGAEVVEDFSELALVLLLGTTVTLAGLQVPGVAGWLLVPLLLLVIRPASVLLSAVGRPSSRGERVFVAWFGVRGIGSLYYAAAAIGLGVFTPAEEATIFWTVVACVLVSIVAHGVTASALTRRLIPGPTGARSALPPVAARVPRHAAGGAFRLPRVLRRRTPAG